VCSVQIDIDLPQIAVIGSQSALIASVSRGGNERDIAMVESLVTSYISKPSCVILLTVACESKYLNVIGAHYS
jgi:hypothetical protein